MRDPESLYVATAAAQEVPSGLPLVAGLSGFADAGGVVSQLSEYLGDVLELTELAVFDNDELLDYRARRPTILFDEDHIAEYTAPRLTLSLARDDLGARFLLLTGYEPDFHWESFTRAVIGFVERYDVSSMTWVHAIPMPVPHTRPVQVTVSGNRDDLIEQMSIWKPRTQAPAHALHLLEWKLAEQEFPVTGFVALVPHYLADTEFPLAAVTAIESISAATGLILPTERLREEGRVFLGKVESQVEGNEELKRLVSTLEERHDAYVAGNPLPSPLTDEAGDLPSADEIAAELEKFLAGRRTEEPGAE